jgi:hypothetical protein
MEGSIFSRRSDSTYFCGKEVLSHGLKASSLALGRGKDGRELSCCGKSSQKVSWAETLSSLP